MKYQIDNYASYRVLPKVSFELFLFKNITVADKVFTLVQKLLFVGVHLVCTKQSLTNLNWETHIFKSKTLMKEFSL